MKRYNDIEQGTEAWHQIRKGKITGTTLKAIMGTPKARQDALFELMAERLTVGVEMDYENPMDRGIRLESEAIAAFEFETGKKVERTGFCSHDENDLIAYSPDGLISDEEDVEIKCMGGKNHVKMWLTNEIPDEYYWQVVQAFVVNPTLKKRNFVGYNPDIPSHPLHIIEVTREQVQEDVDKAKQKQEEFLKEVEKQLSEIIKI
jgi:putative phage-type endonuclease